MNLHTILVSTRNYVTARPQNKSCFSRCCHVFEKKSETAIELPFCAKDSSKKEIVLTRIGLTNLPLASKGLIYYKQHGFEEGQDLEEAAIDGFLKAFSKDCKAAMTATR